MGAGEADHRETDWRSLIAMNRQALTTVRVAKGINHSPGSPAKYLRIILWLAIPIVMWWVLKDFSLREIGEHLGKISIEAALVLIGLNGIILLLYSSRWWLILRTQGMQRSYLALAGYRLAAFGVNYFTPGPQFGGEPLQVHLLQKRENVPTTTAAASVTLDKLIELLINFSFLLVGVMVILFSGVLTGGSQIEFLILPVGLLILPLGYLLALWRARRPISWISARFTGRFDDSERLKRINLFINTAEGQVAEFCKQNPGTLFTAAVMSILIWGLMVFEFSLMLRFLGVQVSLTKVLIALTAVRIAFLLPMPAGLGMLEAGQVLAMGLIGVNPALGVSLSLLIRIRDVIIGGLGLWLGGVLSR